MVLNPARQFLIYLPSFDITFDLALVCFDLFYGIKKVMIVKMVLIKGEN